MTETNNYSQCVLQLYPPHLTMTSKYSTQDLPQITLSIGLEHADMKYLKPVVENLPIQI